MNGTLKESLNDRVIQRLESPFHTREVARSNRVTILIYLSVSFKLDIFKSNKTRPYRLVVRTSLFHGENRDSSSLGGSNLSFEILRYSLVV